ncbi:allophanate hydrolase [Patiriisocius marinistellae]|uniref:Allophanate hydrolase n=1 Tax=Patiriisocius marinistellae TaxID=2494560 RepID=A0A5J4FVV9_9FLAO|nr:5-oxoprolinase subunit PxpB [Patiriisocius marinistellae]GEQ86180.1 allophanate hydrolase [Patiriisocius marinistellae]
MKYPQIKFYGNNAFILEWEQVISTKVHNNVLQFQNYLTNNYSNKIIELVPAYNSLAVYLKESVQLNKFIEVIKKINIEASEILKTERFLVHIPVCYKSKFGLDILEISRQKKISIPEIILRHTALIYPVYFIGFLPGFPYLGGLDELLFVKRKQQPRTQVLAGSVAIGGQQTGIYPSDSPGGWNIIGRTPLQLFSVTKASSLLKAGDKVQFYEISEEEFKTISHQIEMGEYRIRKEILDD